eukprot:PhM_4_TR7549/c0_g1_i3/m.76763
MQKRPRSASLGRAHSPSKRGIRFGDKTIDVELTDRQWKSLTKASDDDPAILFVWHHDRLEAAAAYVTANGGGAPARPAWIHMPAAGAYTAAMLATDIVDHVRVIRTGERPTMGTVLIAPNTLVEYSEVKDNIRDLCFDPYLVQMAAAVPTTIPLAQVGVIHDSARGGVRGEPANIAAVPQGACQAFE